MRDSSNLEVLGGIALLIVAGYLPAESEQGPAVDLTPVSAELVTPLDELVTEAAAVIPLAEIEETEEPAIESQGTPGVEAPAEEPETRRLDEPAPPLVCRAGVCRTAPVVQRTTCYAGPNCCRRVTRTCVRGPVRRLGSAVGSNIRERRADRLERRLCRLRGC